MKTPQKPPKNSRTSLIVVGVVGLLSSIALHEMVHIVSHWHQITGVRVFQIFIPSLNSLLTCHLTTTSTANFLAYIISTAVLIATAIIMSKMYDAADTRTVRQILFPKQNPRTAVPMKQVSRTASAKGAKKARGTK